MQTWLGRHYRICDATCVVDPPCGVTHNHTPSATWHCGVTQLLLALPGAVCTKGFRTRGTIPRQVLAKGQAE